jgi:hypothetical protein
MRVARGVSASSSTSTVRPAARAKMISPASNLPKDSGVMPMFSSAASAAFFTTGSGAVNVR